MAAPFRYLLLFVLSLIQAPGMQVVILQQGCVFDDDVLSVIGLVFRPIVLLVCLVGNMLGVFGLVMGPKMQESGDSAFTLFVLSRAISGICHAGIAAYGSVWVDLHAPKDQAASWLGAMQDSNDGDLQKRNVFRAAIVGSKAFCKELRHSLTEMNIVNIGKAASEEPILDVGPFGLTIRALRQHLCCEDRRSWMSVPHSGHSLSFLAAALTSRRSPKMP
eukprot:s2822_g7.t1